MIEILTPDFEFSDERGFLCQLVHEGYKQVNVVYSNAGSARGGHKHLINNETFYVIEGLFEVIADNGRERHIFKKGDMFTIPKGVTHDFNYIENSVLIGLYDVGVELPDGSKDIVKD